jgi:dTDP-glucose 4,6-dehydratase
VTGAEFPFRRTVVTGGAGFLGARLCKRLLDSGSAVVCVDNLLTSSRHAISGLAGRPGFEFRCADVTEPLGITGDVDLVFHCASPASPIDYRRHPLETMNAGSRGTQYALELAGRAGARFVLASTSEVYGHPERHPQREDYWGNVNPVGPRSVYDEAKRFAEAMTAEFGRSGRVSTGIARIFNSYGPGMRHDDGRMVPAFACQALSGQPVTVAGDGRQTRSLCHADDTVRGLMLLAASDLAGPVNIGNPDEATVLEVARRIIALARSRSGIVYVPLPEDDPPRRKPDIGLARRALGFEPEIGWQEGLAETVAWFAATRPSLTAAGPAGSPPARA